MEKAPGAKIHIWMKGVMTTLISQNGNLYDTLKLMCCLHILQIKTTSPRFETELKKKKRKVLEGKLVNPLSFFAARGDNQISSESSVYSSAVILTYRTLAGIEQRDDPQKTHSGCVAGAGGGAVGVGEWGGRTRGTAP